MVTDLNEILTRPITPEDFKRLRSAWKIPDNIPDKHIMKYINSQKSKGVRIGEDEISEVEDIQRRAGISTNWDRDAVLRALKSIDDDFVAILDEFYGIEDEAQRRELIQRMEDAGKILSVVRRIIQRV